jgi:Family of unknown function (DUF5824)
MYSPKRYFTGISKSKKATRKREMRHFGSKSSSDPSAYTGFKTDKGIRTKTSKYTAKFAAMFPKAKTLAEKAKATGVPLQYIRKCYDRGMAAWRTGHRPGATQQQWGYARVHSFLTCGKTYRTTDADLAAAAKKSSSKAKSWWTRKCRS